MIVHVHYCFQVCLFIFNLCFDISTLNLRQMAGRGMAAPLVAPGRNTSLKNKNKNLLFLIAAYSVPSPLLHISAITHAAPLSAASGPHDNPSRG